jgi:ubiquitin-like-conjugating enzyme ATG3
MQAKQKLYELYKGTVERVTGPRTVSAFLEKGVLSVPEFILAGDNLVAKCPTWSWYAACLLPRPPPSLCDGSLVA